MKRVVIAGCRDYINYKEAEEYIDYCLSNIRKEHTIIIISGGASGADAIGEKYAHENGFENERYPAEWSKYGRSAGPKRNEKMALVCDLVICLWDGKSKGTKSMIEYANKYGKQVRIKDISKNTSGYHRKEQPH